MQRPWGREMPVKFEEQQGGQVARTERVREKKIRDEVPDSRRLDPIRSCRSVCGLEPFFSEMGNRC